jgi:hypothetical protein
MPADHGARYREVHRLAVSNSHYFRIFAPSWILPNAISPIDLFLDGKDKALKSRQRSVAYSDRSVIRKRYVVYPGGRKKSLQVY